MDITSSLWNFFWLMLSVFVLFAYLMLLFSVISDLFRDRETSGWVKAVWFLFLILLPILTALVYVIVRGKGMNQRALAQASAQKEAADTYIRGVAAVSPAQQIAEAKALLEAGTITAQEFASLKAKALA